MHQSGKKKLQVEITASWGFINRDKADWCAPAADSRFHLSADIRAFLSFRGRGYKAMVRGFTRRSSLQIPCQRKTMPELATQNCGRDKGQLQEGVDW